MVDVYLDTSFLMEASRNKVDVFTQIPALLDEMVTLCTVSLVFDELKKLSAGDSNEAKVAKLAFILAKQQNLKTKRSFFKKHADDALLSASEGQILATQDIELKKRAKAANIKLLTIRQRKFVARG